MTGPDLIPDSEGASRFLPWVVAVMVFFAALAGAVGLTLHQATGTWRDDLANKFTVEIPPNLDAGQNTGKDDATIIAAVINALGDTPGVIKSQPLDALEIGKLLQPWLGVGDILGELPLPHLIDVQLSPDQSPDLSLLAERLSTIGPGIKIDDHQIQLGKLVRLSQTLQWMMLACLAMICFATCAVVIFGTRAAFAAHLEVVDLLHVMGARDGYIARLFLWRALTTGLKGGFIGLAVTAVALYYLSSFAGDLEGPLLDNLTLTPLGLLLLASLPFLAALLTAFTARHTVLRELSRIS